MTLVTPGPAGPALPGESARRPSTCPTITDQGSTRPWTPPLGRHRVGRCRSRLIGMEAEPAQSVGAHADDDRAVPVAVRPDPAHEVDLYIPYGEGVPVDAPVTQSNRHQPPRPRAAGDVLEAEEGHPVGSLFAHGHVSVHGRHHGAGSRAAARTKTRTHKNPQAQGPAGTRARKHKLPVPETRIKERRPRPPPRRRPAPSGAAGPPSHRAPAAPPAARGGVSSSGGRRPSAPPSGRWAR